MSTTATDVDLVALGLPGSLPQLPQVDREHSLQVARLALSIFNALAGPLTIDPGGRALLAAAALWHDSGQAIRVRGHHKHSLALIMQADLPQFGELGKERIACIARYHRKALPSLTHQGFGDLPKAARRQVRQLAAILRVADGLDYAHQGYVRSVRAELLDDVVTLLVHGPVEAEMEVRRAYEKADLFLTVFKHPLEIQRAS